jgi:hypothetical protein
MNVTFLLVILAILLSLRKRNIQTISIKRFSIVFVAILLMHIAVIGSLVALHHWKHI